MTISLTLGNSALPLAYRLVRHAQCVCKLLLCHIQRLAAGRHKSAYFFAIHSNASFWCAARCIHNAGPRCLACLLYHTPPGRGNTRPVEALSTQRRAGRAPARPANTCKMQARRGACFYRPSAHGIANERYHKPHSNPIAAMGAFHAFPTRCKTVCGCPRAAKIPALVFCATCPFTKR